MWIKKNKILSSRNVRKIQCTPIPIKSHLLILLFTFASQLFILLFTSSMEYFYLSFKSIRVTEAD